MKFYKKIEERKKQNNKMLITKKYFYKVKMK